MSITKTRQVLSFQPNPRGKEGRRVTYSRQPDDNSDVPTQVKIDVCTWDELGCPEDITITIEPGDLLNEV